MGKQLSVSELCISSVIALDELLFRFRFKYSDVILKKEQKQRERKINLNDWNNQYLENANFIATFEELSACN